MTEAAAALPAAAQRVQAALDAGGAGARVIQRTQSTHTAQEAAEACGCAPGQIVKSLVFRGADSGKAWLALVSGVNRVNEKRLGRALGEALARADADFVRAATGYAIGGVAPLAHPQPLPTVMDADLMAFATVWAAGGTPRCVFETTPQTLARLTGAQVMAVR